MKEINLLPRHVERFWSYVDQSGGPEACWLWKGGDIKTRYGCFRVRTGSKTFVISTHKLAFLLAKGPIPEGMEICHTCDKPHCCNPAHLWAGTHQDNMRDSVLKGRRFQSGQPNARKLSPEAVAEMRRRFFDSDIRISALCREFDVNTGGIGAILTGRCYFEVDGPTCTPEELRRIIKERRARKIKNAIAPSAAPVSKPTNAAEREGKDSEDLSLPSRAQRQAERDAAPLLKPHHAEIRVGGISI